MDADESYMVGATIVGVPVFIGAWIYFTMSYGFLGFCLGWFPAYFAALILGLLWPLIAVGVVLILVILFQG